MTLLMEVFLNVMYFSFRLVRSGHIGITFNPNPQK